MKWLRKELHHVEWKDARRYALIPTLLRENGRDYWVWLEWYNIRVPYGVYK